MRVIAIAAMAENRVIGRENGLPWKAPEDLKFFKEQTQGCILIMGRKTFESLPRPLPGRPHIVISRSALQWAGPTLKSPNQNSTSQVQFVPSLKEALQLGVRLQQMDAWPEKLMVCGGGEVYRQALEFCDEILLTLIHQEVEGDTFFPELPKDRWRLVSTREAQGLQFQTYHRV
ncbi:MAG: dihydrofolate reductase [Bdellovibrio sp.]